MDNFCVTFVFCIDYIEKMDNFCPQKLFPFVFFLAQEYQIWVVGIITFQKIYRV